MSKTMMLKKIVIALMMGISIGHGALTAMDFVQEEGQAKTIIASALRTGEFSKEDLGVIKQYLASYATKKIEEHGMEGREIKVNIFPEMIYSLLNMKVSSFFKELNTVKKNNPENKELQELHVVLNKFQAGAKSFMGSIF